MLGPGGQLAEVEASCRPNGPHGSLQALCAQTRLGKVRKSRTTTRGCSLVAVELGPELPDLIGKGEHTPRPTASHSDALEHRRRQGRVTFLGLLGPAVRCPVAAKVGLVLLRPGRVKGPMRLDPSQPLHGPQPRPDRGIKVESPIRARGRAALLDALTQSHDVQAVRGKGGFALEFPQGVGQPAVFGRLRGLRQPGRDLAGEAAQLCASWIAHHRREAGPVELGDELPGAGAINLEVANEACSFSCGVGEDDHGLRLQRGQWRHYRWVLTETSKHAPVVGVRAREELP